MGLYWAIILSKAGYGEVKTLLEYPADLFMAMLNYENFINDYNNEVHALNRRE